MTVDGRRPARRRSSSSPTGTRARRTRSSSRGRRSTRRRPRRSSSRRTARGSPSPRRPGTSRPRSCPTEDRGDFFPSRAATSSARARRQGVGPEAARRGRGAQAVGDQVEVQISLRTKHAAEYVHLRDPRGAGLRAGVAGLALQVGPRDRLVRGGPRQRRRTSSSSSCRSGEYTFKYRLRANMAGTFRVGPATVQSMYAPEFNAYSTRGGAEGGGAVGGRDETPGVAEAAAPPTPCRAILMILPGLQHLLGRHRAEELDELGDEAGPAGLVARADARAVVAVEVLVELQVGRASAGPPGRASSPPKTGRRPSRAAAGRSARAASRSRGRPRQRSHACPDPVGHSTFRSSP